MPIRRIKTYDAYGICTNKFVYFAYGATKCYEFKAIRSIARDAKPVWRQAKTRRTRHSTTGTTSTKVIG